VLLPQSIVNGVIVFDHRLKHQKAQKMPITAYEKKKIANVKTEKNEIQKYRVCLFGAFIGA